MILLNGLPPIFGLTFVHTVIINALAIVVEYQVIKRYYNGNLDDLLKRVIASNMISVLIGTVLMYTIPESIGGAFSRSDEYEYSNYDKFAIGVGLLCVFIANVIIEIPAYFIDNKYGQKVSKLISVIFIANLITNIPVVLFYLLWVD